MSEIRSWRAAIALVGLLCWSAAIAAATPAGADGTADLKGALMGSIHKMDNAHTGLFNEDVTAVVASSFPPGQPMADTFAILKREGFGPPHRFKGEHDPKMGSMYVSTTRMMVDMSSNVDVVVDFDFTGPTPDRMVVRAVKAFVRSNSM